MKRAEMISVEWKQRAPPQNKLCRAFQRVIKQAETEEQLTTNLFRN